MAELSQSLEEIIADIAQAARENIYQELSPSIKKIVGAAMDLEDAFLHASKKDGAGRSARKNGNLRSVRLGGHHGRPAKNAPRGALKAEIHKALVKSAKPLNLVEIRNIVIKTLYFKRRDPMTLYRQIVRDIKKIKEVRRTGRGVYALSGK